MDKNVLELATAPAAARTKATRAKTAVTEAVPMAVTFPQGLIGCPDWQHFQLMPEAFEGWGEMISTDHDGLGLVVGAPEALRVHYNLEIDEDDVEILQLTSSDDVALCCILTFRRDEPLPGVFANLAGPLVINLRTGLGKQVVLDNHHYPLRAPILEGEAARQFFSTLAASGESLASAKAQHQTPAKDTGEGASSC